VSAIIILISYDAATATNTSAVAASLINTHTVTPTIADGPWR
jgi:hypothetical protein